MLSLNRLLGILAIIVTLGILAAVLPELDVLFVALAALGGSFGAIKYQQTLESRNLRRAFGTEIKDFPLDDIKTRYGLFLENDWEIPDKFISEDEFMTDRAEKMTHEEAKRNIDAWYSKTLYEDNTTNIGKLNEEEIDAIIEFYKRADILYQEYKELADIQKDSSRNALYRGKHAMRQWEDCKGKQREALVALGETCEDEDS